MPLELLDHIIMEVLVVDGVVGTGKGRIIIIDHGLVAMGCVIAAEVFDDCWYHAVDLSERHDYR